MTSRTSEGEERQLFGFFFGGAYYFFNKCLTNVLWNWAFLLPNIFVRFLSLFFPLQVESQWHWFQLVQESETESQDEDAEIGEVTVITVIHCILCHFGEMRRGKISDDRIELHQAPVARRPVIELLEVILWLPRKLWSRRVAIVQELADEDIEIDMPKVGSCLRPKQQNVVVEDWHANGRWYQIVVIFFARWFSDVFSCIFSQWDNYQEFVVFFLLLGEMFEGPVATTRAREATGALTPLHREVPCEMWMKSSQVVAKTTDFVFFPWQIFLRWLGPKVGWMELYQLDLDMAVAIAIIPITNTTNGIRKRFGELGWGRADETFCAADPRGDSVIRLLKWCYEKGCVWVLDTQKKTHSTFWCREILLCFRICFCEGWWRRDRGSRWWDRGRNHLNLWSLELRPSDETAGGDLWS